MIGTDMQPGVTTMLTLPFAWCGSVCGQPSIPSQVEKGRTHGGARNRRGRWIIPVGAPMPTLLPQWSAKAPRRAGARRSLGRRFSGGSYNGLNEAARTVRRRAKRDRCRCSPESMLVCSISTGVS